mgnify:CR=1 FL=1
MDNETLSEHSNITSILMESRNVDPKLFDRYIRNRAIDEPACTGLIVMYSVLITLGALGNILVVSMVNQDNCSLCSRVREWLKDVYIIDEYEIAELLVLAQSITERALYLVVCVQSSKTKVLYFSDF